MLEVKSAELYAASQQLIAVRTELEARVEERTRALSEALDKAQQLDTAKTRFLGHISHELRNPLTSILGYTIDLLEQTPHNPDLHTIQRNANQLLSLINELLDFAQIDSGSFSIEPQRTSVRALLDELDATNRSPAEKKGLRFAVSIDDAVPEHLALDGFRVRQILQNFLGNGLKFTETGALAVRTFLPSGDGRTVRFDVLDTGRGIPANALTRVFEPFQQTEGTDRTRGTGLGLPICRRLARAMGGEVSVQSTVGRGSCFSLELPLDVVDAASLPAAAAPEQISLAGITVLLAEDSVDSRSLLKRWLERAGAEVRVASNGHEAIDRSPGCDVVLMDVQMPLLDGLEATRHLRGAGFGAPILALTAQTSPESQAACADAGFTSHLGKPLARLTLLQGVRQAVDGPAQAI